MNAHLNYYIAICSCIGLVCQVPEHDHRVTPSYHEGEVRLYDSKFSHVLSGSPKEEIALMYKEATQCNILTVRAMPAQVQQQNGGGGVDI